MEKVAIITRFYDGNVSIFFCNKDKIKSNVIYEFTYPGGKRQNIRKTVRCIITPLNKHAKHEGQP